jgi:hypothetical protein
MTTSADEALALQTVAARRRELEERLAALRATVKDQVGVVPRKSAWLVVALGLAAGVAMAWRVRSPRR